MARAVARSARLVAVVAVLARAAMLTADLSWAAAGRTPHATVTAADGVLFALSLVLGLFVCWLAGRVLQQTEPDG